MNFKTSSRKQAKMCCFCKGQYSGGSTLTNFGRVTLPHLVSEKIWTNNSLVSPCRIGAGTPPREILEYMTMTKRETYSSFRCYSDGFKRRLSCKLESQVVFIQGTERVQPAGNRLPLRGLLKHTSRSTFCVPASPHLSPWIQHKNHLLRLWCLILRIFILWAASLSESCDYYHTVQSLTPR